MIVVAVFYCIFVVIDLSIRTSFTLLMVMSDLMALVNEFKIFILIKIVLVVFIINFKLKNEALFLRDQNWRQLARHRNKYQPLHHRHAEDNHCFFAIFHGSILIQIQSSGLCLFAIDKKSYTKVWLKFAIIRSYFIRTFFNLWHFLWIELYPYLHIRFILIYENKFWINELNCACT